MNPGEPEHPSSLPPEEVGAEMLSVPSPFIASRRASLSSLKVLRN